MTVGVAVKICLCVPTGVTATVIRFFDLYVADAKHNVSRCIACLSLGVCFSLVCVCVLMGEFSLSILFEMLLL